MTRYEYTQLTVSKKDASQTRELNRYATDGWRVVHVSETSTATVYLLEREPAWTGAPL